MCGREDYELRISFGEFLKSHYFQFIFKGLKMSHTRLRLESISVESVTTNRQTWIVGFQKLRVTKNYPFGLATQGKENNDQRL
jgi:hypothetical protein